MGSEVREAASAGKWGAGAGAGKGADAEVVVAGGAAEVDSDGAVVGMLREGEAAGIGRAVSAGNWGAIDVGVAVVGGKAVAGRGLGCGVEKEAWG